MGVGEDFRKFCDELIVGKRDDIAQRAGLISRRLNLAYWYSDSHDYHSFYTGSFGRGTAIGLTSDVDLLFRVPYEIYQRFNGYVSNGQAALLQEVRGHIIKTYKFTNIGSDGCVVAVPFDDGVTIEVLPAFVNKDGSYTFPNSQDGGSGKTTNPKPEIDEIAAMDGKTNGNLKSLCKMARAWKATCDVPMGGLLIDTLAYSFIRSWEHREKSYLYYDWLSRDFFEHLVGQDETKTYWLSPGAGQYVWKTGSFTYKAKRARNMSVEAIEFAQNGHEWSARQNWRRSALT